MWTPYGDGKAGGLRSSRRSLVLGVLWGGPILVAHCWQVTSEAAVPANGRVCGRVHPWSEVLDGLCVGGSETAARCA